MVRKILRSILLFVACLSCLGTESASAHFPFHRHCFARPFCPTPVVWGAPCWPRYPVYCPPRVVCAPIYYRPVVYAPICYPTYCSPVIYDPFCYTSFGYSVAIQRTVVAQPIITNWTVSRSAPIATRQLARTTSVQPVVQKPSRQALTTYSPIWTESAVGLIDDMMDRGEWELAHQSLQRMNKIKTPLDRRVLLRQAVMDLVAHRESIDAPELDRIMDRFAQAAEKGSRFAPEELRGDSLSNYLRESRIELDPIFDSLAQRVIEQPERSGREMLLLSVLLKLDGQADRASLFAKESRMMAARSDAFRWKSVLQSLGREFDADALLASKD